MSQHPQPPKDFDSDTTGGRTLTQVVWDTYRPLLERLTRWVARYL